MPGPASANQVCAFVTAEMKTALPQIPTVCMGERVNEKYYDIHILSPTNVLESKDRRAWATVMFATFEKLPAETSLHGSCGTEITCDVSIADNQMAEHMRHYGVFINTDFVNFDSDTHPG
jgi:hypothetical protein